MPRWAWTRLFIHLERFFCCGKVIVNKKKLIEGRRRYLLHLINQKGLHLVPRDHKLREDLLNKKIAEKVLKPDEMEVVKLMVNGRQRQMTHAQQEELERKLEKAERAKAILTAVNNGTKDKSMANLELYLTFVLNRKSSEQSRNIAYRREKVTVVIEDDIQTIQNENEAETMDHNVLENSDSDSESENLEIDIEIETTENEIQFIEKILKV